MKYREKTVVSDPGMAKKRLYFPYSARPVSRRAPKFNLSADAELAG
jgi:hypothetical protein